MLPDHCQIALKEWAVTVQALARGEQILLLRKGGIHEDQARTSGLFTPSSCSIPPTNTSGRTC